jgi:hypothetical protein
MNRGIKLMKALALLSSASILVGVVGCTNMTPEGQGTLSGAAMGAAAGAGISAIAGGNAGIGAAVGGLMGGVAGNMEGRRASSNYYRY